MPANTSPVSAICGTRAGCTNAPTSMTGRPAAASASTNATFAAVSTRAASFCRPSRGPTSTTRTRPAGQGGSRDLHERHARLHQLPFAAVDRATAPSRGARIGSSIFIASSITTVSPARTAWPASTSTARTVAGIGAVEPAVVWLGRRGRRRPPAGATSSRNTCPSACTQ
jgi:hypothetical protein